jgi:hypothetical protein
MRRQPNKASVVQPTVQADLCEDDQEGGAHREVREGRVIMPSRFRSAGDPGTHPTDPKVTDDVEGHAGRPRADRYEADDGDGMTRPLEAGSDAVLPSDEDDVEGHRVARNAPDSDDQDDVEGHARSR